MKADQDINRELLILAGEINEADVKLSSIRNRIAASTDISEYTEVEIVDLTKTHDRIKLEYAEAVNLLCAKTKEQDR